jgi:glycosyltransferase involved in cell wall biosynthesis
MMLTVTLPVYNAMPYLPAAVQSVLNQSYGDFEFLIIDDGSTDGSADYIRSLRDPRIKLVVRDNRGLGATLNELFDGSRGKYIARMDADDICEPLRLERQLAYLRDNDDVVMVGTGIAFIVGNRVVPGFRPLGDHLGIRRRLLQKRPGVNHPTIVVKRDAWTAVGGYRLARAGEDLDFCLRLCDIGRVSNICEPLYRYRLRRESLTFATDAERNVGYAFAVACAKARERGVSEPDLQSFQGMWSRRSMRVRAGELLNAAGGRLYRYSIIHRAEGRAFSSKAYLLGAAMCLPHAAWSRLTTR